MRLRQRQPQRRFRRHAGPKRAYRPFPIFEGEGGYFKAVSRQPFELEPFGGENQPVKIWECSIKRFPLGQYSQTVVQAALEVRQKLPDVEDIAQVSEFDGKDAVGHEGAGDWSMSALYAGERQAANSPTTIRLTKYTTTGTLQS